MYLSIDQYTAKLRELNGPRLLEEIRDVIAFHDALPDNADGRARYAACFDLTHEAGSSAIGMFELAKLQVEAERASANYANH